MKNVHTILITGGDPEKREEKARQTAKERIGVETLKSSPDFFEISSGEEKSIKIKRMRQATSDLQTTPSAKGKVLFIKEAEKLTREAQNSILKLLEEPPSHATIILSTQDKSSLLPTIVSRCVELKISSEGIPEMNENLDTKVQEILKKGRGARLDWVKEHEKYIKEENALKALLENWLHQINRALKGEDPNWAAEEEIGQGQALKMARRIQETLATVRNTNADKKLAVETLLLKFPVL